MGNVIRCRSSRRALSQMKPRFIPGKNARLFAIEAAHPAREWTLVTPWLRCATSTYVNKCGFHIVEFFNEYPDTASPRSGEPMGEADSCSASSSAWLLVV